MALQARSSFAEQVSAGTSTSAKPRLRGVLHQIGFFVAVPLGLLLVLSADPGAARAGAAVFAASVVAMFGASAFYHRPVWSPAKRRRLRRLDHAGIFGLIAGTYTPVGLLVLSGHWRTVVLAIVWSGSAVSIALRLFWEMPKWLTAVLAVALGWVAIAAFPLILAKVGVAAFLLVFAGGVSYTLGALVYACKKPDWRPDVFGYHELFHGLVVAAVAFHYAAVAFFVLPRGQ